jgi:beta-lactamase regulating signal transducer with metallopeptidase domain
MPAAPLLAWLGEASIVLALVALLVLLARRAARGRLSARSTYALWLAVPLAILATLAPAGLVQLPAAPAPAWLPEITVDRLTLDLTLPATGASTQAAPLPLASLALSAWLVGLIVILAAHLGAQWRFDRAVVAVARRPETHELEALAAAAARTTLVPDRDFRLTDRVAGPLACGLFRPLVLLPEDFLARYSEEERRIMALHEAEHVRAGHIAHRLLARALRGVFWFHPLAWLAERAFAADQELACDQGALALDPTIRPRTYAAALLKAAEAAAEAPRAPSACIPLVGLAHLKERTVMLARHASIGRTRLAGALVMSAVAALAATAGLTSCGTAPDAKPARGVAVAERPTQGVAAIVNGEVISTYDVQQRMRLILATKGAGQQTVDEETFLDLRNQSLDSLISERLRLQAAQAHDVEVEKAEIDSAMADLARRNNTTASQIRASLEQAGVDPRTLEDQLRAELAWQTFVVGRYGPAVSSDQVMEMLEQLERSASIETRIAP